MERINWTFYYTTQDGEIFVVGTGDFIKPNKSKLNKTLDTILGKENVKRVGYCQTSLFEKEREYLSL